eukprot:5301140-Pleurochrysis_carterae.AAC.1
MNLSTSNAWAFFLLRYKAELCPSCKRMGLGHCIHQAANRNGKLLQQRLCGPPSQVRDHLRNYLWGRLCVDEDLAFSAVDAAMAEAEGVDMKQVMQMRAVRALYGEEQE